VKSCGGQLERDLELSETQISLDHGQSNFAAKQESRASEVEKNSTKNFVLLRECLKKWLMLSGPREVA
jgi:hypothetical protein